MSKAQKTREQLLETARKLFWSKGYSNVSLRDITKGAGVDVALVSRYFGGKQGLFEETIAGALDNPYMFAGSVEDMLDAVVAAFTNAHPQDNNPTVFTMILMNVHDEEVGDFVRALYNEKLHRPVIGKLGDDSRAALFSAVVFGYGIAQKSLMLPGIAPIGDRSVESQLRQLMQAAITYDG